MANRKTKVATNATDGVRILWEDGFFRNWRRIAPIEQSLAKRDNHFSGGALGMALRRAKYLTRRGKPGGFEYIQKYPFVAEAAAARK